MSETEHLTNADVSFLRDCEGASERSAELRQHLLVCATCREMIAVPTRDQFLRALFVTEPETNHDLVMRNADSVREAPDSLWWGLSLSAVGLLIVSGLVAMILLKTPEAAIGTQLDEQVLLAHTTQTPQTQTPNQIGWSDRVKESAGKIETPRDRSREDDRRRHFKKPTRETRANIASTRGEILPKAPCSQQIMNFDSAEVRKSGIVISWKRPPEVSKSYLFVSDENEVLIEEFESATATSYTVKNKLLNDQVYVWKVVFEMPDGSKRVGSSGRFVVKPGAAKNDGKQRDGSKNVRCS